MPGWTIRDREGREIYLTEERWNHIVSRHSELRERRDEVLETVTRGQRRQQPHDPQTYVYRLRCNALPPPLNGILVVVTFRFQQNEQGEMTPNNFMITAWGIMMR